MESGGFRFRSFVRGSQIDEDGDEAASALQSELRHGGVVELGGIALVENELLQGNVQGTAKKRGHSQFGKLRGGGFFEKISLWGEFFHGIRSSPHCSCVL